MRGQAMYDYLGTLTDADLATLHASPIPDLTDVPAIELRLAAAGEVAARRVKASEAAHAAFHGKPLRYGTVERRRGYRGRSVCLDCYYGKEWRGSAPAAKAAAKEVIERL